MFLPESEYEGIMVKLESEINRYFILGASQVSRLHQVGLMRSDLINFLSSPSPSPASRRRRLGRANRCESERPREPLLR